MTQSGRSESGNPMSIPKLFKSKSLPRAAVESMLIMFGVLAALAVQSWWDNEVERGVLLSHLTAVQDELHEASESIAENLRESGLVVDHTKKVFMMLADTKTEAMPDFFVKTVSEMYTVISPDIPLSAFDAFVSSGSLRLINDKALRAKFAEYRSEIDDAESISGTMTDVYYDLQAPFLNKHFVLSDFGWEINADDAFGERIISTGEVPKAPYTVNWNAIRSLEYWNLVYDWRIAYGDHILAMVTVQSLCQQLEDLLQAEIEKLGP